MTIIQKILHFNKLILKILILAFIYHQFMSGFMWIDAMYNGLGKPDFYSYHLPYSIPYLIVLNGFALSIFFFSPAVFLLFDLLYLGLFYLNKFTKGKIAALIRNLIKNISRIRIHSYLTFFILTLAAYYIFITFAFTIPIWIYKTLFNTNYVFFEPIDAVNIFFNYEAALRWGVPGYLIFLLIILIIKFLFKKEINIDKFRIDLLSLIKKL